jgi:restriction endonuclease Mrr
VELARLMVQHNVGVRTRTTYELKKVDEDYFTE